MRDTATKIGRQLIRRVEAVSRGFHSHDVAVAAVATKQSAFAAIGTMLGERLTLQLERRAEATSGESN